MEDSEVLSGIFLEMRRGTLTLAVLSQLKTPCYGYSLLQRLQEKHTSMEAGTLYPLLRRLESQGLLDSQWDTAENRPRKYYMLSSRGHVIYKALKDEWLRLTDDMTVLLKEESE